MKRTLSLICILAVLSLSACSVQEMMSPQIFMRRLFESCDEITPDGSYEFYDADKYICFVTDLSGMEYAIEITSDDGGNAKKISLACTENSKAKQFIPIAQSMIKVYAPDDSSQEIINALFLNEEASDTCRYFETQWHSYSAASDGESLYFSASKKKLTTQNVEELSLKANDKVNS